MGDNFNTEKSDYITLNIADQLFGISVLEVQDVLGEFSITHVPTARPEIAGSLNLRGHIVTAIDMRKRLNLPPNDALDYQPMSAVVEYGENLYSLIIDSVGDVLSLRDDEFETNPPTLDTSWQKISKGIFKLDDQLLVILDIPAILKIDDEKIT